MLGLKNEPVREMFCAGPMCESYITVSLHHVKYFPKLVDVAGGGTTQSVSNVLWLPVPPGLDVAPSVPSILIVGLFDE